MRTVKWEKEFSAVFGDCHQLLQHYSSLSYYISYLEKWFLNSFDLQGLTDSSVEMRTYSIFFPWLDCLIVCMNLRGSTPWFARGLQTMYWKCYFEVLSMAEVLLGCAVVDLPLIFKQLNWNKTNLGGKKKGKRLLCSVPPLDVSFTSVTVLLSLRGCATEVKELSRHPCCFIQHLQPTIFHRSNLWSNRHGKEILWCLIHVWIFPKAGTI